MSRSNSDEPNAQQIALDYLSGAEERIARLEQFVAVANSTADKEQLPFIELMSTERDVKQIAQKLKLAREAAKEIESDTRAGLVINRRYHRLAGRLIDADAVLLPLRHHLLTVLDPQSFPDLKDDALRLQGIANMISDAGIFESNPTLAIEIFAQLKPATFEFERVIGKYNRLIEQNTTAGRQLAGLLRYFESKNKSFSAASEMAKSTIPLRLKTEIGNIVESLKAPDSDNELAEIVKTLPSKLTAIDDRVKLFTALSPENNAWREDRRTLQTQIQKFVADLKGRRLLSTALPDDVYQEKDRDKIVALVKSAWSANKADAGLVSIRIPEAKWKRQTVWKYFGQPSNSNFEDAKFAAAWRRDDESLLDICVILTDPTDRESVMLKRVRIRKRLLSDGSESVKTTEAPFSIDADLRYWHPAGPNR